MYWLARTNQVLFAIAAALLCLVVMVTLWPQGELVTPQPITNPSSEETSIRPETAEALEALGETVFNLKSVPPTLQLPDLRRHLLYYGANKRPDAQLAEEQAVHISLRTATGSRDVRSVLPEQPVYLVYVAGQGKETYAFSQDNAETGLWLEIQPEPEKKNAIIKVYLRDQNERVVVTPDSNHQFTLTQRPLPRYGSNKWEIDGERVDANILVRKKARWYGIDRFLIDHGSEDASVAKQSIRFEAAENPYAVRVAPGEYLIWKDGRWQPAEAGEQTIGYPLIMLDKVEERVLRFQIWDEEGKFNIKARLSRANERWAVRQLQKDLRFAGARTRTRMNLDIAGQRFVVQPQDWILYTDGGEWQKIDTLELLDSYVNGSIKGMLLVIDGMERSNGQQALAGHVFSPSRSDRKEIRLLPQEPFVVIDGAPTPAAPVQNLRKAAEEEKGREEVNTIPDIEIPEDLPPGIESEDVRQRLEEFRKNLEDGRMPRNFKNLDDIRDRLRSGINPFNSRNAPRIEGR